MIFYFSGTGNSRWAAKTIAEATGDELVFIPAHPTGEFTAQLADGERLGFVFPVHGWRPPMIVRDFIKRLRINAKGHFVYAVCTAGDDIGETMKILSRDLEAVGIHLDSAFSLIMPESYMGLPFFNIDKPAKEKAKKEKAARDLKVYLEDIKACHKGVFQLDLGHWPRINSRVLGSYFVKHLVTDKPFRVDSRKCVKCGICADVCPTKNVIGGLGYEPQWKHDGSCVACFACYHHCPHHAIEYGNRTEGKGQYFYK